MIIVTGMHRSGTSVATQILSELGMDLGGHDDLLAADQWNAQGYWENLRVLDCNDRMVLGTEPFYPSGYYRTPRDQRSALTRLRMNLLWARFTLHPNVHSIMRRARRFEPEMKEINAEFGGIVVKDPRFSITLPAWQQHQAAERLLIMIRRPDEVANSLYRRNRMPMRFGLALWRLHYNILLQAMEGIPTVFVDFNRLLQQNSCAGEIERICRFAEKPVDTERTVSLEKNIVNPRLATEGNAQPSADAETEALYQRLQKLYETYDRPLPFKPEPAHA